MPKEIIAVARGLATEIRSQENQLDTALAGQARLVGSLLEARVAAGIPAAIGAGALEKAFEALEHGRKLRGSLLAVHQELAQVNLRELAIGDMSECPPSKGALRLVPDSSAAAA